MDTNCSVFVCLEFGSQLYHKISVNNRTTHVSLDFQVFAVSWEGQWGTRSLESEFLSTPKQQYVPDSIEAVMYYSDLGFHETTLIR